MILAPSRELANQIYEEALTFCKFMNIRCYALVGGGGVASIEQQGFAVRQVENTFYRHTYIHIYTCIHICGGVASIEQQGFAVRQVWNTFYREHIL